MSVDLIRTSVEVVIHESLARPRLSRPSSKFVVRAEQPNNNVVTTASLSLDDDDGGDDGDDVHSFQAAAVR